MNRRAETENGEENGQREGQQKRRDKKKRIIRHTVLTNYFKGQAHLVRAVPWKNKKL